MQKYIIDGGRRLRGETEFAKAKNAVLPILAASLMADGVVTLHKCSPIADICNMLAILRALGCRAEHSSDLDITIDTDGAGSGEIPGELAR